MITILYPETHVRRRFGRARHLRPGRHASSAGRGPAVRPAGRGSAPKIDGVLLFRQWVARRRHRPLPAPAGDRAHGRRLRPHRPGGRGRARHHGLQRAGLRHDRSRRPRDRAVAGAAPRPADAPRRAAGRPAGRRGCAYKTPLLRRLSAQTFGIVGLGRIGTAAALRAKALGFKVVFYDPYRPNGAELAIGVAARHAGGAAAARPTCSACTRRTRRRRPA